MPLADKRRLAIGPNFCITHRLIADKHTKINKQIYRTSVCVCIANDELSCVKMKGRPKLSFPLVHKSIHCTLPVKIGMCYPPGTKKKTAILIHTPFFYAMFTWYITIFQLGIG